MTLPAEVEEFRLTIAARLGLSFDEARTGALANVLDRRAAALGLAPSNYLRRLREPGAARDLGALARDLTVGETYFFRNADQLRAFREVVLPERARSGRKLRILSAGCASGEEPYTLAILLREHYRADALVTGVDVNPEALQRAARMRYSPWSLREVPSDLREAWFRRDGGEYVLRADVAQTVRFEERNLADPGAGLFEPDAFDVVFCRNVLMYFTPEAAKAVVASFARSLTPGGYLFLGHAENLRGISGDFHLLHTHGTFYYQHRVRGDTPARQQVSDGNHNAPIDGSWVGAIREATERVRSMTEPRRFPTECAPPDTGAGLGLAMDLIGRERFAEAFRCLGDLPGAAAGDPDVLLLRAVVQTQTGDLAGAERSCEALLRVDETSASAHYVLALCREAIGDLGAAAEHDRIASVLDPTFAMPCIHLGLIAGRRGDVDLVRSALGRGLVLLEREDPSRILLFGGGFGRQALMALCRGQLDSTGGP